MNHPRFNQLINIEFNNKQPVVFDTDPDTDEILFFNNKTIKNLIRGHLESELDRKNIFKVKMHTIDNSWFERIDKKLLKFEKYQTIPNKSIITKKNVAYPLIKRTRPHKINRKKKLRGKKRYYQDLQFKLAYAKKYRNGEQLVWDILLH